MDLKAVDDFRQLNGCNNQKLLILWFEIGYFSDGQLRGLPAIPL